MNKNNIGNRIKKTRLEKGLTLQELGEKVGLTHASLSKYESGNIENIPINRIMDIAEALEVAPSMLMGWNEEESPQKRVVNELIELTTHDTIHWTPEFPVELTYDKKIENHLMELASKYAPNIEFDYREYYFYYESKNTLYIASRIKKDSNKFIYTLSVAKTKYNNDFNHGWISVINCIFLLDSEMVDNIEYLYYLASGEATADTFINELLKDLKDLEELPF